MFPNSVDPVKWQYRTKQIDNVYWACVETRWKPPCEKGEGIVQTTNQKWVVKTIVVRKSASVRSAGSSPARPTKLKY